jgi:thiamine-phosphate pyrophosphorylase
MKIVVYTLPYAVANETDKINQLFDAGLTELHIRKPGFSKDDLYSLLSGINPRYHSCIVLHQKHELSKHFQLKGLHFGPNYFKGASGLFRRMLYAGKSRLQLSTAVSDIKKVDDVSTIFDRVFVGPMYKKFSEQNVLTNFDPFEVKNTVSKSSKSIYAYGGIDYKNQERIESLGFQGLVLQSSVWKSGDVVNAFRSFLTHQSALEMVDRVFQIA